jgi:hypothetical protein
MRPLHRFARYLRDRLFPPAPSGDETPAAGAPEGPDAASGELSRRDFARVAVAAAVAPVLGPLAGCVSFEDPAAGPFPRGTPMTEFPPAGTDRVRHDLRIALLEADAAGNERELELLQFSGQMTLERGNPYTNQQGLRQVDFVVTSWAASAYSRTLGQEILYVLSPDVQRQPASSITAEQRGSDFPATFDFNVVFDARVNNQVVHRRHHGRPRGHGFRVVPPTGDRATSPTITEFEDTVIRVPFPGRDTMLVFRPRDCNDQSSETVPSSAARAG